MEKRVYKHSEEWRRKHREWSKRYYWSHRDEMLAYKQRWNREHKQHNREIRTKYLNDLKSEVLTHYGGGVLACVQCGFSDIKALTIDHIKNDGNEHRRAIGTNNSQAFYLWLKNNNFPEGFQTLCYNCQMIKEIDRRSRLADEKAGA